MQPKVRVVEKRVKRKNGLVAVYLIEYRNLGLLRYEDSGGHVLDHKRSETANLLPTLEVVAKIPISEEEGKRRKFQF